MAVGLVGGVDDERDGADLEAVDVAQVEDDVEVPLGVDQVPEDGVEDRPPVGADLAVDGDDDRSAGPGDVEARGPGAGEVRFGRRCRGRPLSSGAGVDRRVDASIGTLDLRLEPSPAGRSRLRRDGETLEAGLRLSNSR